MPEVGTNDDRERSDLFSVSGAEPVARPSIAPVSEILVPPAEKRRIRLRRISVAVVAVILLGLTAFAVRHFWHEANVEAAALEAGDGGRAAETANALDTLDDGEALGLRARLIAAMVHAGERSIDEGVAALEAAPEDESEAAERRKAEVYLALARGDAEQAWVLASPIMSAGEFGAETAYVKSLAALARGDEATAVTEAAAAASTRPGPRYLAQHGLALGLQGDTETALTTLTGDHPAVRTARARVLSSLYREEALQDVEAVGGDATATATERAWAELARARISAHRGQRTETVSLVLGALEAPPPGDDSFVWSAAETLILADALAQARTVTAELDPAASIASPATRGWVLAALALSEGDGTTALARLSEVPASPAALWLVGRAHALSGDAASARTAYEQAVGGPLRIWAFDSAATLELKEEDPEAAVRLVHAALEAEPHHPVVVRTAVRALLAHGDAEEAGRVADAVLEARPDDVRAVAAKSDVLLAAEVWDEALPLLRHAVELDPSDAELHASHGRAARLAGEDAEAKTAYEAALALQEGHPDALVGLLALAVAAHDIDQANALVTRIDAAEVPDSTELALLRVRTLVDGGAGQAGVSEVSRMMRRRDLRGDASLRQSVAELFLQAESYVRSISMFDRARLMGDADTEARLGRAIAWVLEGRMNRATDTIQEIVEATTPEDGGESPAQNAPRMLVTRGRIEANLGRFPSAQRYAERALEVSAGDTEAHLLLAEIAIRQRRDPEEHLRAAIAYPRPQPKAFWMLARRGETSEEACAFAARYVSAAPRGEFGEEARERVEACEASE